ncbi:Ger(x)C family spore germination protein [Paenibacillus cremeus]|uniref:Ger(X)C family spore germination protein n=1 Tax=Paenibacillus cremeus TaxID=2163881 RepID=A0A559KDG5_9BACL|nr:Ger(x)C family spore germination protein [Paenibacillus cremeus]TVY10143.1 Ger(x)C family spore germination protein [Paenibacillus cremeus]
MRRLLMLGFMMTLLTFTAGCWDIKSIQDTNYVTAVGLDFKNGKYVVYGQMLDFSSVAKQEGGKAGQPPSVWAGTAEGDTISNAFNKLYETSQQRMFWGHVSSVVFTEDALKLGLYPFLDSLSRVGETRYKPWVYGTKEPIDKIFTVLPFFNLSPIASILHNPIDVYKQFSFIRPLRLYKVIVDFREPNYTVMLPSLEIATDAWKKNEKPDPKLKVSGAYAIQDGKLKGWVEEKQLNGLRWLERSTMRTPLVVYRGEKPIVKVTVEKSKRTITPQTRGQEASFSVHFSGNVLLDEINVMMDEKAIKQEVTNEIRDQITNTFKYGQEHSIDLYRLTHVLYRESFPAWSRLTQNGSKPISYSLQSIDVELNIVHSGMNQFHIEKAQY